MCCKKYARPQIGIVAFVYKQAVIAVAFSKKQSAFVTTEFKLHAYG